jgi:hypothetical protein
MAKFKFPRNPHAANENPFEDEQGANPFVDDAAPANSPASQSAADQNPYAVAEPSAVQPYQPGDYETFLPDRSGMVWWLGLIGCCIELLAMVVAIVAILSLGEFLQGMAYGLPGQLIGLAVSVPAWIMGQSDARAIAAGAMEARGRRATQWGLWLGIFGTLLAVSQLFLFFGFVLLQEF